jgi:hypothetical protein
MEEWTTVQFADMPDLLTRRAIMSWVEERVDGRAIAFNTTDWLGRRRYGYRFQREDDARRFESRWLSRPREA